MHIRVSKRNNTQMKHLLLRLTAVFRKHEWVWADCQERRCAACDTPRYKVYEAGVLILSTKRGCKGYKA